MINFGTISLMIDFHFTGGQISGFPLDPEIDRVDRSSRSFDDGVELSRWISEKSSRSIESIVRVFEVELVDFIQKV